MYLKPFHLLHITVTAFYVRIIFFGNLFSINILIHKLGNLVFQGLALNSFPKVSVLILVGFSVTVLYDFMILFLRIK